MEICGTVSTIQTSKGLLDLMNEVLDKIEQEPSMRGLLVPQYLILRSRLLYAFEMRQVAIPQIDAIDNKYKRIL